MRTLIIIFFLLSTSLYGQLDSVRISGIVLDQDNHTFIKDAEIIITDMTGKIIKTCASDCNGSYSTKVKISDTTVFVSIKVTAKTKPCNNNRTSYLQNHDKRKVYLRQDMTFVVDFELKPAICRGQPEIVFKKNSSDLIGSDDSLYVIYQILLDIPGIVIEINAHCDTGEKDVQALSDSRAQIVKSKLIEKGINERRMKIKGFGSSQLLVTKNDIKEAKTVEEKEALRSKNRRATFKVLSFDFKE